MACGTVLSVFALLLGAAAGADNITAQLQQTLDHIVSTHLAKYPNLTMSFAWKDASQEIAVASGVVLDRPATTEDTFLYGSGTKPLAAAAVMRLIDQGLVHADDKADAILDPYLARMGKPSMEEYFGEGIKNATVLSLVRMGAGVRDFEDDFSFDKWTLGNGSKWWGAYPYDAMDFSVSPRNVAKGGGEGPLICPAGGNCTAYASTSFLVAGLLLTAVLEPEKAWYDFDLGDAIFKNRSKVPSMRFPPMGSGGSRVSDFLTVPGYSIDPEFSAAPVTIYDQDTSILGWTCGNMVARPTDVARFFYWALDEEGAEEEPLVSSSSRAEMMRTQVLTKGWEAGRLRYGAGIQDRSYGNKTTYVSVKGHEGATFAFLSSSGYVPELNGSYSLIGNTDKGGLPIRGACPMLEVVKRAVTGDASVSLGCRAFDSQEAPV